VRTKRPRERGRVDAGVFGQVGDPERALTAWQDVAATAFPHRGSRITVNVAAMYERPDEEAVHEPWVDAFAAALRQGDDGAYVGFLQEEGEARVRAAYPGATWERLVAVKKRYDPGNVFRLNHNVPPS
jgi:hypothetical protein